MANPGFTFTLMELNDELPRIRKLTINAMLNDLLYGKILQQLHLGGTLTAAQISSTLSVDKSLVEKCLARMRRHKMIGTLLKNHSLYYAFNRLLIGVLSTRDIDRANASSTEI